MSDSKLNSNTLKNDEVSQELDYINFKDLYDRTCSLQKSSLAFEDAIWFGIDNPEPMLTESRARALGITTEAVNGWVPYPMPAGVHIFTRMYLTREQVAALLPTLQCFIDTGELSIKE